MENLSSTYYQSLPDSTQTLLLKACLSENSNDSLIAWNAWIAQKQYNKVAPSGSNHLLPQFFDNLDFGSQRLLSFVYKKMSVNKIDDPLIKELRGYYRYVWVRNQVLNTKLEGVIKLFDSANIKHVVVKGFPTIEKFYNDWGTRSVLDLDVAIQPNDFNKAISLLKSNGWKAKDPTKDPEWIVTSLEHAYTLIKDSFDLDLHIRFTVFPLNVETKRKFWSEIQFYKPKHAMLKPEHQLICSFLHGFQGKEEAMRTITDSTYIIRKAKIDWKEVIEIAQSCKAIIPTRVFIEHLNNEKFIEVDSKVIDQLRAIPFSQMESTYFKIALTPGPPNGLKESRLKFLRASIITPSDLKRIRLVLNTYRHQWGISSIVGLFLAFFWVAFDKLLFPKRKIGIRRIPFQRMNN